MQFVLQAHPASGPLESGALKQTEGAGLILHIPTTSIIIPYVDYDIGISAVVATARRPHCQRHPLVTGVRIVLRRHLISR